MHNCEISAKKKFSILTKLMKNQKSSGIPPLIEDNEVINDPLTKSNIFNDMFAAKATVHGNDDPVPELAKNENIRAPLNSLNTSPIEVAEFLRKIKKSKSSYCGVSGLFLATIATPISFPLYKVFNNLFEVGHFPDFWKLAHVTAIWKRSGLKSSKKTFLKRAVIIGLFYPKVRKS